MVNKRNREIFGRDGFRLSYKQYSFLGVLVVAVVFSVWLFLGDDSSGSATITSTAVAPLPVEEVEDFGDVGVETVGDALVVPDVEEEPEEKAFYEYGGQCAADVKRAEDDVLDVQAYLSGYRGEYDSLQSDYDSLKADYEAQLAALEITYGPDLERLQEKIGKAEDDLGRVESALAQVRVVCEP
jgi:hypothetical protein